ncbi:hypothetical protein DPEC_G00243060 [Dallia pectoralis]|uniref:Uncharacterized protein n=1 Tax=Dallia pectoralis TaxID=75939 RepID=A0ACC2FVN3_DALPE|nr:hypothetical protein DPEC_G00243060 [Dallia pectoralis]
MCACEVQALLLCLVTWVCPEKVAVSLCGQTLVFALIPSALEPGYSESKRRERQVETGGLGPQGRKVKSYRADEENVRSVELTAFSVRPTSAYIAVMLFMSTSVTLLLSKAVLFDLFSPSGILSFTSSAIRALHLPVLSFLSIPLDGFY